MVVKKNVAPVKTPGNTESVNRIIHSSGVDHSRLSEGSESHHDWHSAGGVVNRFVPIENPDRIRLSLIAHSYSDDLIIGFEKIRFVWLDKFGLQQGRNPIFGRTSREDLLFWYNRIF